jgi:outer membrane protein OmpA-like peptidoglycan-associated protein
MTSRIKLWIGIGIVLYILVSIYNGRLLKNEDTPSEKSSGQQPQGHETPAVPVGKVKPVELSKIDSLQLSLQKKSILISELEKQLLDAKKQLGNKETALDRTSSESKSLLLGVNDQEKQNALLKNEIEQLKSSIQKRDLALEKANSSIARQMTGNIQTGRELKQERDRIEQLNTKLREALFDLKDLQTTRARLEDRTNALSIANERIQSLAMMLENSTTDLAAAESAILELQQEVSKNNAAKESSQQLSNKQTEELAVLRENLQKQIAETGGLHVQLIEAKNTMAVLRQELDKANLKADAMLRYGTEKDKQLAPSTQELWDKNKLLKEKTEELDKVQAELASLNKERNNLSIELDSANKTLLENKKTLEENTKNSRKLEGDLYSATKIITILKTSLNIAKQTRQDAEKKITALNDNLSALQATLANNDKSFVILKTALEKANQLKEDTAAKLQAAEKNAQLLKSQLDSFGQNLTARESDLENIKAELSASAEKVLLLETALDDTKSKLTSFEQKEAQKNEQLTEFQKNSSVQALTMQEKSSIIDQLTAEIAAIKVERDKLNLTGQQTLEQFNQELTELKTALQNREAALSGANQKVAELNTNLNTMSLSLDGLKEEKESLQTQLEKSNSELAALQSQPKDVQEDTANVTPSIQDDAHEKLLEAEKQIQQLKKLIEEKEITHQQLSSTIKTVVKEKEELSQQVTETNTRLQELSKLEQPKEILDSTPSQEEMKPVVQTDPDTAVSQTVTNQIQELETALQNTKKQLLEKQQESISLLEKAATLEKERDTLRQQVMTWQVERTFLKKQVMSLQTERDDLQQIIISRDAQETELKQQMEQLKKISDSDNDSVSDTEDQCPDTVEGVAVNKEGCEKDTDSDGLVDRMDLCPQSPQDTTTDKTGCGPDETIILTQVQFEIGTAALTSDAKKSLENVSEILKQLPEQHFELAGFTDNIGDENRNLQISVLRARAVMEYLVKQGIDENRLVAKGYGPANPIGDNNTSIGRGQNRRVELHRINAENAVSVEIQPESTVPKTEEE